jgi:type II secretory pathway pseudopilin PulG
MKRALPSARACRRRPQAGRRAAVPQGGKQEGYALLLALFLAALVIIATASAVPSLFTESRRQKEAEMIWRGKQYERAIGLYYRKTGHFPQSMDQLVKGVPGVHFLRKAYKDPMNDQDGSWRLIYLGANGQLIGSTRFHTLAEYQAAVLGPAAGALGALAGNPPAPTSATPSPSGSETQGQDQKEEGTKKDQPQQPGTSPAPPTFGEGSPLLGGALVGVGSKVKKPSLKVFLGGSKYNQWEFIWSPVQIAPAGTTSPIAVPGNTGQPQPGQPAAPGTEPAPAGSTSPSSTTPQQ